MLSPGQDHDLTCAESLIEAVDPGALLADMAFDADAFIAPEPVDLLANDGKASKCHVLGKAQLRNMTEIWWRKRYDARGYPNTGGYLWRRAA